MLLVYSGKSLISERHIINTLITILARKGSKGLPYKNFKSMNGKPLMFWTVDQAWEWKSGYIAISTDIDSPINDCLIANTPDLHHMDYIFRDPEFCKDDTPKLDAIRNAVEVIERRYDIKYDCIIDLDVTNPLRKIEDIEACFQIFKEKRPKTVVSVTKARKNPYFNQIQKFKHWEHPAIENGVFTRRQDAPEVFDVNSCIYIYDRRWLDEGCQSPITDNTEIYIMEDWQFCDIDNAVDFFIVEKLMGKYLN